MKNLENPSYYKKPIKITGYESNQTIDFLKKMYQIREAESCIAEKRKEQLIRGPVHLGIGQEAIAVGVSKELKNNDYIFGGHRSHSHILAAGGSVYKLFAEVLGRQTGFSKGMGGSMHLIDQNNGFYGSVPIVAGTVPLALGAALASKLKSKQDIAVAYFGDGAIEEGVIHESMNMASTYNLPIIFILENNFFASHMHMSQRQPDLFTYRFAKANLIPFELVDGNDVISMNIAAKSAINKARRGDGPSFIEAITYRWLGHVDWREDIDVGISRSTDTIFNWKQRDPISRLEKSIIQNNIYNKQDLKSIRNEIKNKVLKDWEKAMKDPQPEIESLTKHVYFES